MLSSRGASRAEMLDIPWRYAAPHTYDKETNPTGTISFGMAEHGPMRTEIANYINQKVTFTPDSVGYRPSPPSSTRLPAALSTHLHEILHPHPSNTTSLTPETIFVASSATALGHMLGFSIAEPGDGILVSRPVYGRFELDYGVEAGVEMVYADNDVEEGFEPGVVGAFESALRAAGERGVRIRGVLIVNPHNPVGRCYPAETLTEIVKFCSRHQLHLISDEVYASCIFDSGNPDAVPFTSVLSLDLPAFIDPNLVHLLYGFSKDFASGGLRLGFLISQNGELRRACQAILRLHSTSTAAVTIGATILEDRQFVSDFFAKSSQHLTSTYKITTSTLEKEGINYVKGGNAGFFIYIDLSPYLALLPDIINGINGISKAESTYEYALAQKFLDAGIFLHPGEEHGKKPGWFRLVFSHEEEVLEEGLRRFVGVLRSLRQEE
ncbi:pyridoxal phosphate-dependent aminotransferase [Aspergillus ruber CBS 135680]|uniref:Aspartate aminotransferase n=1 Tax=Aspergillus ruber (strain CBS 135680) TaxID=1388766 RepID=A0A017S4I7_ASPRC|nr:aspartate aminotransferase [Aspergillus ruber CBS 135680]EYE91065.1 aspartate aminotransferase [Aspergillus ruber CBS 135680]